MKTDKADYANNIVAIGVMARQLQKQAANPNNHAEVYKLATDISMESQEIRRMTNQPKKLLDYIKRVVP